MHLDTFCCRGPLVSVAGIRGVGKTYLTPMLAASLAKQEAAPVVTEDFSARQQPGRRDLGRDLLKVLPAHPAATDFFVAATPQPSAHRQQHGWSIRHGQQNPATECDIPGVRCDRTVTGDGGVFPAIGLPVSITCTAQP